MLKHLPECNQLTFAAASPDAVHKNSALFFGQVLKETPRLSAGVVQAALNEAYPGLPKFQKQQVAQLLPPVLAALNKKKAQRVEC